MGVKNEPHRDEVDGEERDEENVTDTALELFRRRAHERDEYTTRGAPLLGPNLV